MANKVCCETVDVDKTKEMNDRDYLVDLLSSEKDITKNMCVAITEASNKDLRDAFFEIFEEVASMQEEAYILAWNNGWYSLEEAEEKKIKEKVKELQKKLDEFSN